MVSIVPPGSLVYGMQLPVQAQSRLFVEPWETRAGPDALAAVARACDEAGFFYVAVCDHVAIPRDMVDGMSATWWDTVTTLAWVAAQTSRVRLLTHVYVPAYRHPLVSLKTLCTLDVLSAGRLVAGVGAGHVAGEFAALGVEFDRRGAILDEAIDVLRAGFAEEYPEHDGPRFHVHGVAVSPRPVQQPRPPIWVGGSSPAAQRRAAVRGDGWLPQGGHTAEDIARVRELRATVTEEPIDVGAITEWLYVGEPGWDVGRRCVSGPAEKVADHLRHYAAMGVDHVQVRFRSRSPDELVDQVRGFGSDVAPLLGG